MTKLVETISLGVRNTRDLHEKVETNPAGPRPLDAVAMVRGYIAEAGLVTGQRLPPERDLAPRLGVSRSGLRQALAVLETTGEINRHVGRGTFVGSPVGENSLSEFSVVANMTNPLDVIDARLMVEPAAAFHAALKARPVDHWEMERILVEGESAADPVASQLKGDQFHRSIAAGTHNPLIVAIFDAVYRVRSVTTWGQLAPEMMPREKLTQLWREHRSIADAIRGRDAREAERRMREHVDGVRRRLLLG